MKDLPTGCIGCPLATSGHGFVHDLAYHDAQFEVRGERPWKQELATGVPFSGQAGFVLKQWGINMVPPFRLALDRNQVNLTNTLRCLPPNLERDSYPRKRDERLAAERHCQQYSRSIAPVVVLAGEHAQRAEFAAELDAEDAVDRSLGHDLKGVMGRIGRVYERNGKRYIFAPHPSAVLRSPYLVSHLQAALRIAADPKPRPVVNYHVDCPRYVAFDAEWSQGKISVLGFATNGGRSAVAYPRTETAWAGAIYDFNHVDEIVMHNGHAADLRALAKEGVDVAPLESKVFDTMLAMHATHAHLAGTGSYDIRSVVLLLGEQGGERFPLDWKNYAGDIYETCRLDAAASLWVAAPLKRLIAAHHLEATVDISHKVAPIFARMYERGVRLDTAVLERIHNERQVKTQDTIQEFGLTEQRGKKKIKEVPIWRSDKVLDKFESLFKLRPPNRSRKTWEALSRNPRLPECARRFAMALLDLGKGANDAHWLGQAEADSDGALTFGKVDSDGYIHPQYAVHGSPDRPIAKGPNIQNFPRPSDDPRPTPLRAAVVPHNEGEVLLSLDYSAVETYTTAVEADDGDMLLAIQEGRRSHEQMATDCSKIAGTTLTRAQGKTIGHAFDKCESPANLAKRLFSINFATRQQKAQCTAMYLNLLKTYPKTAAFRDRLWEQARSNPLIVSNKFGRRLECFARSRYGEDRDWDTKHDARLKYWCPCKACMPRRERFKYAMAFIGRSSACDALLRAMARIWQGKLLNEYSLPVAEVHDSLLFSIPLDKADKYAMIAKTCMQLPISELGGISLPCVGKLGKNWAEAS